MGEGNSVEKSFNRFVQIPEHGRRFADGQAQIHVGFDRFRIVAESNNGHHSRMNLDSCRFVGPSDR